MSFFTEIALAAGLSELALPGGYNVINYSGKAVYLEGVVRLILVESQLIKLELRGAIASIIGNELVIFELSDCAVIKGEIFATEFAPFNNLKKEKKHEKSKTR